MIYAYTVGQRKLTGLVTPSAPRVYEFPRAGVPMYPSIAVPIRDVQVAIAGYLQIRGQIERISILLTRSAWRADGQQQVSILGEFADAVRIAFGAIYKTMVINVDAMSIFQHIFAPGLQEIAFPIKNHHGVFGTGVDIDPVQ